MTEGVYSHIRHPQYAGLFLITVGLLIQWPTLITLLMWPTLTFAYYRLAMREEGESVAAFQKNMPLIEDASLRLCRGFPSIERNS